MEKPGHQDSVRVDAGTAPAARSSDLQAVDLAGELVGVAVPAVQVHDEVVGGDGGRRVDELQLREPLVAAVTGDVEAVGAFPVGLGEPERNG